MAPPNPIGIAILGLILTVASISVFALASPVSSEKRSVYRVLKSYGLPMGLLPKGVKRFELNETGWFEVHLDQACNAKFESELHYERNVSGILSYGQISNLSGISAQDLFLWFPVKKIRVDVPSSGVIYFDVGVVFKQFSLALFETPLECVAVGDDDILAQSASENQPTKLLFDPDQRSFKNFMWNVFGGFL